MHDLYRIEKADRDIVFIRQNSTCIKAVSDVGDTEIVITKEDLYVLKVYRGGELELVEKSENLYDLLGLVSYGDII